MRPRFFTLLFVLATVLASWTVRGDGAATGHDLHPRATFATSVSSNFGIDGQPNFSLRGAGAGARPAVPPDARSRTRQSSARQDRPNESHSENPSRFENDLHISRFEANRSAARNSHVRTGAAENFAEDDDGQAQEFPDAPLEVGNQRAGTKSDFHPRARIDNADALKLERRRAEIEKGINATRLASTTLASRRGESGPVVAEEEEKLRKATVQLVLWLRDRARQRLADIAVMSSNIETEKQVLAALNETAGSSRIERMHEIQEKLTNQKKLAEFRRSFAQPERELRSARDEDRRLADQLARYGEQYNALAAKQRVLEAALRSGGFTHWLETRGKEYLPRTAVGVLSKSTMLLAPVPERLERVVAVDHKLATNIEHYIPRLSDKSLTGKVVRDWLMLLPGLPLLAVLCRLLQSVHRLSLLHIIMYLSILFMAQSVLLLFVSACVGGEALRAFQLFSDDSFVLCMFIDAALYAICVMTHILIAALCTSRNEVLQTAIALAIGYHYYLTVFRQTILNREVSVSLLSHFACLVHFFLVWLEKKRMLGIRMAYEKEVNAWWKSLRNWTSETVEAMQNVFHERDTEMAVFMEQGDVSEQSKPRMERKEERRGRSNSGMGSPVRQMRGLYERWSGTRALRGNWRNQRNECVGTAHIGSAINRSGSRYRRTAAKSTSRSSNSFLSCHG